MKIESTINDVKRLENLQSAKSIRLPILESPKLSSEVSESKGRDILRSHLKIFSMK